MPKRSLLLISWPVFILYLLLPLCVTEIGASVVQIGLFFSASSLITVLMRPLVGWAVDRCGRRLTCPPSSWFPAAILSSPDYGFRPGPAASSTA